MLLLVYVLRCRFNSHPVLNDRYLLLSLLGKGGFSEVHKVSVFVKCYYGCYICIYFDISCNFRLNLNFVYFVELHHVAAWLLRSSSLRF